MQGGTCPVLRFSGLWHNRRRMGAYVIPAFQAEVTIGPIVRALGADVRSPIVVVDDGSTDQTAVRAEEAGALVLRHGRNLGKGAALQTALAWASEHGHETIVSLDADGQHPAAEAIRLMQHPESAGTLLLGVRNLRRAGAPTANRRSNAFSNLVLSWFAGRRLEDTQCGLRRYPTAATLALGARARGFAFEADVVLRAARRGLRIAHVPCDVFYPEDRTTHFRSVRDPARIVARVVATWLTVPHHRPLRRWFERSLWATLAFVVALSVAHFGVGLAARFAPPQVGFARPERSDIAGVRSVGPARAVRRQGVWEVLLLGSPEQIGWAHARLLEPEMVLTEQALFDAFEHYVPTNVARQILLDLARFQYREVDRGMSTARRRELAAQAAGFQPDPFARFLPTYQRFVYLNALYDISLSLEHSPLLGCTSFTESRSSNAGGPFLARVFDFEVHSIFDQQKALYFVAEDGQIPFASVAWPGLTGVVTGMNVAGVGVVVHGARGGDFATRGEPVVHAVRRVLGHARTTGEAIALFDEQPAMVSHLMVVQDAAGRAVRLERVPGRGATVIELPEAAASSNHFEGPLARDPKNRRVMRETSTLARRARGDALLENAAGPYAPRDLASFLRDRKDATGQDLPAGDRRAIDADIATHAVIMDLGSKVLWVNQGPHLAGEFVRYDLVQIFDQRSLPSSDVLRPTLPR